jgi:hypothetical protein
VSASRSSGGLLLAAVMAGDHVPPTWADVDVGGGLVVCVASDALRAGIDEAGAPVRLPASYAETIAICRALDCVPPTREISDAIWRAASVRVRPQGLVVTTGDARQMATVEWSLRHNAAIEGQLRDRDVKPENIVADVGKDWILDNGLAVRGAVNYGWRADAHHLLQPLGHAHNAQHWDYSQVVRLVKRCARLDGAVVDLLDVLVARGLAKRWAAALR